MKKNNTIEIVLFVRYNFSWKQNRTNAIRTFVIFNKINNKKEMRHYF